MIQHYIKIAFRNLWKYKTQSVISITGLAVGFTCFALASLWMRHEKSYDNFYRDTDRIYMVRRVDKDITASYDRGIISNLIPDPLVTNLRQDFPEVEMATKFDFYKERLAVDVKYNEQLFKLEVLSVDTSFVDLFGLEVVEGDLQFLRKEVPENKIALSESKAKKIFGKESVLGKTVIFPNDKEYVVTAIMKDRPGPSNFPFDILMQSNPLNHDWHSFRGVCFVKLYPNVNPEVLNEKIGNKKTTEEVTTNKGVRTVESVRSFETVPISKVRSNYPFTVPEVEQKHILLFILSGTLLILCSLFNFFTLFISRFRIRRKEFAIRFVNGSSLGSLFFLLVCEFFVILLLALLLSIVFIKILFPGFCLLAQITINLSAVYGESLLYIFGIIFISLIIFFICIMTFRKQSLSSSVRKSNNHVFRKISIALQLIISIGFIFCTIVMQKQLRYLHTVDIGFNYKNIGEITMYPYPDFNEWEIQMLQIPGIKKAVAGNPPLMPATIIGTVDFVEEGKPTIQLESFAVSEDYFEIFDLQLVEGKFFTDSDPENVIVITESVARALDQKHSIGEKIQNYTIKGLIKDIHNSSPTLPPKPMSFRPCKKSENSYRPNVLIFSYEEGNWELIQKQIKNWQEENYPQSHYTLTNSEDVYNDYFRSEEALLKLIGLVSLVCIIISIFGFVSMVSLTCEERRKEMAIRKVNGARIRDILTIFYKEYFLLLLFSAMIIFPIVYYIMNQWIENYTLQTSIPAWIYILIIVVLAIIIIACVGWKVMKTAKENPADVLKSE